MKYKIYTAIYESNKVIAAKLRNVLKNHEENNNDFNFLFVIGGDGTYAKAVREHAFQKNLKIIGINGGNVGFFSSFSENNLEDIVSVIPNASCYKRFHLIKLVYKNKEYFAFNDVVVFNNTLVTAEVYFDGNYLESYRGSGVLFSTKYGSTGYNKSAGGPVILPQIQGWVMNELFAQRTNEFFTIGNPVLLPLDLKVTLKSNSVHRKSRINLDGIELEDRFDTAELDFSLVNSESELFLPCTTEDYVHKLRSIFLSAK